MELYIKVPAEEAGRLLVSIMQDRLEIGLASGRMVSFEGASGDIAVKLLSEETVSSVPIPTEEAITNSEEEVSHGEQEQSSPLFGQLVALRRQIAAEEGHPPFIIFHDSTLSEMCRVLPKDMKEFKTIQGIGEAKLVKYGQRFLDAINN